MEESDYPRETRRFEEKKLHYIPSNDRRRRARDRKI